MERRAIVIRGIVQGVGFRPFVYNLAGRLRLGGFVRNRTGSIFIEAEGESPDLDQFLAELAGRLPHLDQLGQRHDHGRQRRRHRPQHLQRRRQQHLHGPRPP